jgi:hypothetical protein
MADASFWYYPAGQTLLEVNLGRDFNGIAGPWQVRDEDVTATLSGTEGRFTRRVWSECTISLSGIVKGQAARRQLENFVAFARTGATFAFAADRSKASGAWIETVPQPGDTTLTHAGNVWRAFNASAGLTTGDSIVIQSGSPEYTWEETTVDSFGATTLVAETALQRHYSQLPILGRHRDFWPFVRLARGDRSSASLFVNNHRWTYTLEMRVEEDTAALLDISDRGTGVPFAGTTEGSGEVGPYARDDLNPQTTDPFDPGLDK